MGELSGVTPGLETSKGGHCKKHPWVSLCSVVSVESAGDCLFRRVLGLVR